MQFVGRLNATTPVYTNAPDLIYMLRQGAMLSLSLTFLDAQIPVDSRTLSPIYVPSMILLVALLIRLVLMTASGLKARLLVSTCLALLLGAQLQVSANWLQFKLSEWDRIRRSKLARIANAKQSKTGDAYNDAFFKCAGCLVYVAKQSGGHGSQETTYQYKSAQSTIPGANCGIETPAKGRPRTAGIFLYGRLALVLAGSRGA